MYLLHEGWFFWLVRESLSALAAILCFEIPPFFNLVCSAIDDAWDSHYLTSAQ